MLVFILATVSAKDDESNEISSYPRPPVNLDANLRRALLKALTELENEENAKLKQNSASSNTVISLPHLNTNGKIVEKASASAVSFYTDAIANAPSTTIQAITTSTTTEKSRDRPIVIVQRSKGLQHKPITSIENTELDPFNDAEQILASASNSFRGPSKFAYNNANVNKNDLNQLDNYKSRPTKSPKLETSTATTTTTSTEESEAKVEDVQFFSAPLVAAFTVHQDKQGLPERVVPIYKQLAQTSTQKKQIEQKLHLNQEQISPEIGLQEKQKLLEAEILRLQQQQQRQNYLIRQQQIYHEQQLQLQKEKLLQEEIRIRTNNQQTFLPVTTTNFNRFNAQASQAKNQLNNHSQDVKGSLVSFQPSISFNSNQVSIGDSSLPFNAQILPTKEAVDFKSPILQPIIYRPFSYLTQQQPPLVKSNSNNFNFSPSLVSQQTQQVTLSAPQRNRVFRQESDTGNFLNSNYVNYQNQVLQQQQQPNNRYFRSNLEPTFTSSQNANRYQPPLVNQQLNNLLYNSGVIRGKQHEDFNIISKVLSLNHYGGDYSFAGSHINEQRVPASSKKV